MNAPLDRLSADAPELPADLRLIGIGLNECEQALNECLLVTLHRATSSKLFALGIRGNGVTGRGLFDDLQIADVIFHPGGAFDFSRDLRVARGHATAIIIPARDEAGDIVDLAAWNIESGAFGLWRGVASMLGEDQIHAPRIECDGLRAFPSVAAWLRAGRQGIVILNEMRARWRLAGERIVATDVTFGLRLREMLALPAAQVFVERAVA
jgi:hypothetical protein